MMVLQGRKGKLVFVSSTLGLMSFIGWSSYSPAKHALRGNILSITSKLSFYLSPLLPLCSGLADTLHSELMLYDIDVHIFFPPTMKTPGYEEEMKTKPKITAQIEETDSGLSPDQAALGLFKGEPV
jgi:3-dehydrosphinganine reductase